MHTTEWISEWIWETEKPKESLPSSALLSSCQECLRLSWAKDEELATTMPPMGVAWTHHHSLPGSTLAGNCSQESNPGTLCKRLNQFLHWQTLPARKWEYSNPSPDLAKQPFTSHGNCSFQDFNICSFNLSWPWFSKCQSFRILAPVCPSSLEISIYFFPAAWSSSFLNKLSYISLSYSPLPRISW